MSSTRLMTRTNCMAVPLMDVSHSGKPQAQEQTNADSSLSRGRPLNILADKNQPTGVIDWANAVIAEPAMDVGSAIANISAVPLPLPWALRVTAHAIIGAALRRYERTYRALRPLDDQAVLY